MSSLKFTARSLVVIAALIGGIFMTASSALADCSIVFRIANDNDPSWTEETSAAVGDKFGFEVQVCNWHAGPETVTAKVAMAEYAQGRTKATLTTKVGAETQTREVYLNLAAKSHLLYTSGSTKVTGDFDGDGTKEHNEETWADGMFNGEVSFGTIAAGRWVQSMFMMQVEADTRRPSLIVDKKVSWAPENYQDFIKREDHTFDVLNKVYYHLEVKNTGDRAAENVKLVDRLPQYVRWFDDQNVGEMSFNAGTVEPGQTKGFDYVAIVTPDFPVGIDKVTNHVRIYEGELEKGEDYASIWIRHLEGPKEEVQGAAISEPLPELPKAGFGPGKVRSDHSTVVNRGWLQPELILIGSLAVSSLLFAYASFIYGKQGIKPQ